MSYFLPKNPTAFFEELGIKGVENGLARDEFKGALKRSAEGWLSHAKARLSRRATVVTICISTASAGAAIASVVIGMVR